MANFRSCYRHDGSQITGAAPVEKSPETNEGEDAAEAAASAAARGGEEQAATPEVADDAPEGGI